MPATSPRSRRSPDSRRYRFVQADIGDARRDARDLRRFPARHRHASRRREPCRPLDRRARRLHPDQCRRHLHAAAGGAAATGAGCDAAGQARFRFHHVSTDEVFGSLGAEGFFTETTPYDPHSPYSASKAASDHLVRAWHHTYGLPTLVTQLLEQLRALSFPRKADPADDPQRARGQAAAGLWRRPERPRLAVRRGPCPRAADGRSSSGRPGETYNVGGRTERSNLDVVRADLRPARRAAAPAQRRPTRAT